METMTRYRGASFQTAVTIPNNNEGAEHLTLSHTNRGTAEQHSNSKTQFRLTLQPSHPVLRYYPREMKTSVHIKKLLMNGYICSI